MSTKEGLSQCEALYFKGQLKAARDSALDDAEAFSQICFAIEALGCFLLGKQEGLGAYKKEIKKLVKKSEHLIEIPQKFPGLFASFEAHYETLRKARNDVMHTGAYARHATEAGKSLSLVIEEALMEIAGPSNVEDFVVRSAVYVKDWQPVALARQLMLANSFSFLPVKVDKKWYLLTEVGLVKYIYGKSQAQKSKLLIKSIGEAVSDSSGERLELEPATEVSLGTKIQEILMKETRPHTLWVVVEGDELVGVLSPFELM
jgi:hypothetical protein